MSQLKDIKCRCYMLTIFRPDEYEKIKPEIVPKEIKYFVGQIEECPKTKKPHIQAYIELTSPMRINAVKKIINCSWAHLEPRRGTQQQAISYCTKDESRIASLPSIGEPGKQGKRVDLEALKDLEFMKLSDWILKNQELAIKYPRGVQSIKQAYDIKNFSTKERDIQVHANLGDPGCGKTRSVYDTYGFENVYKLNTNSNGALWFDGYEGQDVLLIDDFKGWIKYTELLTILDRYPYRCQIKGGFTYANWTKVIITSNYEVDKWYNENVDMRALKRRINKVTWNLKKFHYEQHGMIRELVFDE